MNDRPRLQPGPEHPITVERNPKRVVVSVGGQVLADTHNALTLREASYPPVQYVPFEDVDQSRLAASDHQTYCPYKGEAGYYSIPEGGEGLENSLWQYRAPYDAVAEIKDHVAFYTDRVELVEEPAAA